MRVPDITVGINHTVQWHSPELEEVDLLPVQQSDPVIGVRQADERDPFLLPVLNKGVRRIGPNGQDLHSAACKQIIFISQARQLRAAVRSHKAAQEHQNDRLTAKIGQTDRLSLHIFQLEIRSQVPRCNQLAHSYIFPSQNTAHSIPILHIGYLIC